MKVYWLGIAKNNCCLWYFYCHENSLSKVVIHVYQIALECVPRTLLLLLLNQPFHANQIWITVTENHTQIA